MYTTISTRTAQQSQYNNVSPPFHRRLVAAVEARLVPQAQL
jgi:hypothetical protein